jgi:hypothetical protein
LCCKSRHFGDNCFFFTAIQTQGLLLQNVLLGCPFNTPLLQRPDCQEKFFSAGSPSALAGELSAVVLHANGLGWLKPVLQLTRPTASCKAFSGNTRNC